MAKYILILKIQVGNAEATTEENIDCESSDLMKEVNKQKKFHQEVLDEAIMENNHKNKGVVSIVQILPL